MLILNKANFAKQGGQNCQAQYDRVIQQRNANELQQAHYLAVRGNVEAQRFLQAVNSGQTAASNQAALIPRDAFRELDQETKRVTEADEGRGYFNSLMGISKSLPIGKTADVYRRATDKTGIITTSISGQVPTGLSKTAYDYDGDPVPVFMTGYTRPWREQAAFSSEGFDAQIDDQHNSTRDINQAMAIYLLWGNTDIKVDSYTGQGIATHRNTVKLDLGASGANINLSDRGTQATAQAIVDYFTKEFAQSLDANLVMRVDELYVSPSIKRRLGQPVSTTGEYKDVTLEEYLLKYGRIGKIETTFELGRAGDGTGDYDVDDVARANQFFCYVKDSSYLRPLVGQGLSTVALPVTHQLEDMQVLLYSAMGLQVKADRNGRSSVFFASNIT